jgi:hypothetical protein
MDIIEEFEKFEEKQLLKTSTMRTMLKIYPLSTWELWSAAWYASKNNSLARKKSNKSKR